MLDLHKSCKKQLELWISNYLQNGERTHCFAGGYWELLYPLFEKYAPSELKYYEDLICDEFSYFNPRVKEILDLGNEEKNYRKAIKYLNSRISFSDYDEVHYIHDPESGEDIPYLPNYYIDINSHYGRE